MNDEQHLKANALYQKEIFIGIKITMQMFLNYKNLERMIPITILVERIDRFNTNSD